MVEQARILQKIRQLRKRHGLTLDQLAEMTGLSKGYLSKIENSKGKNLPPLSTLHTIAEAFGVKLTWLLADEEDEAPAGRITILRQEQRKPLVTEYRGVRFVTWPLASAKPDRNVDPYLIEIPFEEEQVYRHRGEEFYFILQGRVKLSYGGQEYLLNAGDCVYFDTDVPHSGASLGRKKALALCIFYNENKEIKPPFVQPEPLAD